MFALQRQITGVMTLDKVIARLRNERDWSQGQLAEKAGLSQSAIGNLEAGTRGMKGRMPSSLPAIARAFGMSTDELLALAGINRLSCTVHAKQDGTYRSIYVIDDSHGTGPVTWGG